MSLLIVVIVLCWLFCSLLAGRAGISGLAPWQTPTARFAVSFILWPFVLLMIASLAIFALVFFWDLILYEDRYRDEPRSA